MKMLLISLIVLTVTVTRYSGKKIVCQTLSLETDDMSGYCCVIFRNHSEIKVEDGEIKKQILDSLKNTTVGDISSRISGKTKSESDGVLFPTEDYTEMKFPWDKNFEEEKNLTSVNETHPVASEKAVNETIENNEGNENKTHINETITVIPVNRNAVDIPETCPEGSGKDINGECVPAF